MIDKYKIIKVDNLKEATEQILPVQGMKNKEVPVIQGYMPFRGYKTYFRISGKGNPSKAPLIMMHGGPGGSSRAFEVLDSLALHDNRQIVFYDQIGCGRSFVDGHKDWWRQETWIEELVSLRDYLGLEQCHLLGHSWGAMLIIAYLIEEKPKGVLSATLSSGTSSSQLWVLEQERLLKFLSEEDQKAIENAKISGDFNDPAVIRANNNYFKLYARDYDEENWPECFKQKSKGRENVYNTAWGPYEFVINGTLKDFDYTDQLYKIETPCLVINGTNDESTPLLAKVLNEGIKNSKWVLLQGARHRCYWDNKDEYDCAVNTWLCNHD